MVQQVGVGAADAPGDGLERHALRPASISSARAASIAARRLSSDGSAS
jgi:hypothetical protein